MRKGDLGDGSVVCAKTTEEDAFFDVAVKAGDLCGSVVDGD